MHILLALTAEALMHRNRPFLKWWVILGLNIRLKGYVYTANIYTPLDRGIVLLEVVAESFHMKKLCSRLYSIELEFYS